MDNSTHAPIFSAIRFLIRLPSQAISIFLDRSGTRPLPLITLRIRGGRLKLSTTPRSYVGNRWEDLEAMHQRLLANIRSYGIGYTSESPRSHPPNSQFPSYREFLHREGAARSTSARCGKQRGMQHNATSRRNRNAMLVPCLRDQD